MMPVSVENSVLAADPPSATSTFGRTRAISRRTNTSHVAVSIGLGVRFAGRPPGDHVGDVDRLARQPDRPQHLLQELARAADERAPRLVLLAPRGLADEHHRPLPPAPRRDRWSGRAPSAGTPRSPRAAGAGWRHRARCEPPRARPEPPRPPLRPRARRRHRRTRRAACRRTRPPPVPPAAATPSAKRFCGGLGEDGRHAARPEERLGAVAKVLRLFHHGLPST